MEADKVIEWITHTWGVALTWNQEQMIRNHCEDPHRRYTEYSHKFAEALIEAYREEMDHSAREKGNGFASRPHGCRCHNRLGLTVLQHENDCPLARRTRQEFSDCKVGQIVNEPFENGHSWTCDMGDGTYLVAHREKHIQGNTPSAAIYDEATRIPDRVFMDSDSEKLSVPDSIKSILAQDGSDIMDSNWAKALSKQVHEACSALELVHGHGPAKVVWENDFEAYTSRAKVTMPYADDCAVCQAQANLKKMQEGQ